MTSTETTIGAVAAAILLVLRWWDERKAKLREEARKEADKATHKKLEAVVTGQAEISNYINGSVGKAYTELARVLTEKAKATRATPDILAAHDAEVVSDKHEAAKLQSEAERLARDVKVAAIVSEFNKDEPKTP